MVTAKRIPRQKARKESNAKLEKSIWYTTAYLIPTAAERGRKEHAFLPLVEGSIGVIYPYAESAVAWAGAVLVATCTGLLVKKARTMATTRRTADK